MKGIVLAGGTGSRLRPATLAVNKHLLPVGRVPMIFHPIKKLTDAGITEILIVTGTEHMGAVVGTLGSGKELGAHFTYRVQDEAGGIAQALGLASLFAHGDSMCVILGDNVFQDSIADAVKEFSKTNLGARLFLKEVHDATRFGVATVKDGKIVKVVEKPAKPESNLAVTGIYMYDKNVFSIIPTLKPSGRGELEITDVNNAYIARGQMTFSTLSGWWTDAGTHESLDLANRLVRESGM